MSNEFGWKVVLVLVSMFVFVACGGDEDSDEPEADVATCVSPVSIENSLIITVGVFSENNGVYVPTGSELVLDSKLECQTWSRSALADGHSDASHLHYNAASNVYYDNTDSTISWVEYGPELDQCSINSACDRGVGGVSKSANTATYYQDKNVYLKIISIK